jgi:nitroreductase
MPIKETAVDFTTVLKTRRSVRAYADRAVPAAMLGRVLEAARLAPSACNVQPWRFIVVQASSTRAQIAKHSADFVATAPVVLVCCGKRYPQAFNWMGDKLFLIDVAIAVDHLTLAARNEGLGSCWIGAFHDQPIKELLDIPADHDLVALIPLGFPASEGLFHAQTERLPLERIVSHERFGSR